MRNTAEGPSMAAGVAWGAASALAQILALAWVGESE